MTEQEREKLEREILLERKKEEDEETLAHYAVRLRAKKKHYTMSAEAFTTGGRKNRALAIGECVLQGLEKLDKGNFEHHFLPGTLSWVIYEDRASDDLGKKGYRYTVAWHAYADEQAMTDEEIEKELEETRKKIEAETEEMFGDVSEDAEAGAPGAEVAAGEAEEGTEEAREAEPGGENA